MRPPRLRHLPAGLHRGATTISRLSSVTRAGAAAACRNSPAGAAAGPAVLFVHGWGGNQQQYLSRARAVADLGFICLTFDLRGHARSDEQRETVSRDNNLTDLLAAY